MQIMLCKIMIGDSCATRLCNHKSAINLSTMNTKKHPQYTRLQVRLWTKNEYIICAVEVKQARKKYWKCPLKLWPRNLWNIHLIDHWHFDDLFYSLLHWDLNMLCYLWHHRHMAMHRNRNFQILVHELYLRNFNMSFHCGDLWNVHVLLDWYRHDLAVERWSAMPPWP